MNMPREFIDMLVCPVTRRRLRPMDADTLAVLNRAIGQGAVRLADGRPVPVPVEEALIDDGGGRIYRAENGIPILLEEEALVRPPAGWGGVDRAAGG
jgi:uncharacterized protein YbaR (Trm112 family)